MPSRSNLNVKPALIDHLSAFDSLPNSALIDVHEISALAMRSHASIWPDVNEGRLASPIKLGPNATRWRVGDVRSFLSGMA